MNIVEAICALCFAFMALLMAQNVIAGIEAQSHGVASHQGGNNG